MGGTQRRGDVILRRAEQELFPLILISAEGEDGSTPFRTEWRGSLTPSSGRWSARGAVGMPRFDARRVTCALRVDWLHSRSLEAGPRRREAPNRAR